MISRAQTVRLLLLLVALTVPAAVLLPAVTGAIAALAETGRVAGYLPPVTDDMRLHSHIRYALYFAWFAFEAILLLVFLQLGWSARLRDFAESRTKRPIAQLLIYYVIFTVFMLLSSFPLSFFSSFWLEHHFKLTDQTFIDWLIELVKKSAVGLAVVFPVKWSFFWLVRGQPKRWPVFLWLVASIYLLIQSFLAPYVIEPIFNQFTPLPDSQLKSKIERLADQVGLHGIPIYVADKSKQTKTLNAYVSGLGSTAHVVLWDTTVQKLPEDQVLSIVAHEMGHYVLNHELVDCLLSIAVALLSIPINMYLAEPFVERLPKKWGIANLGDYAMVPVLSLVILVGGFAGEPFINAWSRLIEHEADAFELHATGNGDAMARSFVALAQQNLSEPDPPAFIEFWMFSHPSLKHRIEFALGEQ